RRGDETRTAVVTSAGPVDGLQVQVIRDETELEAVRRARDSVLANISHEFRTPLAAQLASIELLLDNLDSMQPVHRRELIGSLLALRRQRLEVLLPEELPLIEGDKHRLTQVFVNLLANANKFAPEGSTVRIG